MIQINNCHYRISLLIDITRTRGVYCVSKDYLPLKLTHGGRSYFEQNPP